VALHLVQVPARRSESTHRKRLSRSAVIPRRRHRLRRNRRNPRRTRLHSVPKPPHRRTDPILRRPRIPSGPRILHHIHPLAHKIQHKRNAGKQQQQINQRTGRQMQGVVENPGQQQNHSNDDEHGGASNHSRRRPNNPLAMYRRLRSSIFAGQEKFSVVPRVAAIAAGLCRVGLNPERHQDSIGRTPIGTNSTAPSNSWYPVSRTTLLSECWPRFQLEPGLVAARRCAATNRISSYVISAGNASFSGRSRSTPSFSHAS